MTVRIVNCYRGDRVVGSFVVEIGYAPNSDDIIERQCVDVAKGRLAAKGIGREPFDDMSFVVR